MNSRWFLSARVFATALTLALSLASARANMGVATLPETATGGAVALFYPTAAAERALQRGPFTLQVAVDAAPIAGNRRLVVVSHGSGGSPWVHTDLARALVDAGFIVAAPWHRGDNSRDDGRPGPDSWALRPAELSQAIDAVGRDARFAPLLELARVGVYGMSAGGHTALSMAGGRWSRAGFKQHCDANIADDFNACVGLITRLDGNVFDGMKIAVARTVIDWKFADATPQAHHDPRVAAVVAAVPFAADFDMASLAAPAVPLALVTSGRDAWLAPRFHGERVLAACKPCIRLVDLPSAGHGAWLSPFPPGLGGLVGDLLNDPPGFDRGALPAADRTIAGFFSRQLLPATALGQRDVPR